MAGLLTEFLRDAAARPFEWGRFDCALMIADWVGRVQGVTLANDLRGTYETEEDCATVLDQRGGLGKVVTQIAEGVGLERTLDPQPGDIGLVRAPTGRIVCAIKVRRGWAVKTPTGLGVAALPCVWAWRVPCGE